jgi:hypothetical protein
MTLTNKQEWNKRHQQPLNTANSKKDISKISKIPVKMLDEIYDRGIGAYKTAYTSVREKGTYRKGTNASPSKKLSKEQWGFARIYSFVNKIEGKKKLNHDLDLLEKLKKK